MPTTGEVGKAEEGQQNVQDRQEKYRGWYLDTVNSTQDARELSERDRDYYDGIQYTAKELEEYGKRNQPPVVDNRIKPKIDSLVGLEIQTRTDIKAFPRTPEDEDTAEAATDALRFISDNSDFDKTKTNSAEDMFIEGTCACIIEVEQRGKGFEVMPRYIAWDRQFVDPHSARLDCSDAKFMGQAIWMDLDDAKRKFPNADDSVWAVGETDNAGDTYDDKPKDNFFDRARNRVKIIEMYAHEDVWIHTIFTGFGAIVPPRPSPYKDDFNEPANPIVMQRAFIDRDNNSYGPTRTFISIQDAINKRGSKALHLLSTRQVVAEEGAVQNVNKARNEIAKPDGYVELNPGQMDKFKINETTDLAIGQMQLLQEAKASIDSVGANSAITGKEERVMSGRALQARQQSGVVEITPLMDRLRDWEKRAYRQMWFRVRQFWTEERWIRVTDDEKNVRFVGLNHPVTLGEQVENQLGGIPPELVGDPRLNAVVGVENNVGDMDMDIILEDVPDIVNIQAEQFELLAGMYQANPNAIPFDMIIEMSSIRNKDQILERLRGTTPEAQAQVQAQQQAQQEAEQLAKAQLFADIENTQADTEKKQTEAAENMADVRKTLAEIPGVAVDTAGGRISNLQSVQ